MTMNCEHCQAELEDFLYGELGPARASAVKAHLAGCADCREWLDRAATVNRNSTVHRSTKPGTSTAR